MRYEEKRYRKKNRKGEVRIFDGKREKNLFCILQSVAKKIIKREPEYPGKRFSGKKKDSGGTGEGTLHHMMRGQEQIRIIQVKSDGYNILSYYYDISSDRIRKESGFRITSR